MKCKQQYQDRFEALYEKIQGENRSKKKVLFEVMRNGYLKYIALDYERDYDKKK